MRRHQDGGRNAFEEALQPDDRLDVEVVGRLVEQQDIEIAEEDLGHGDAHLPAAGESADIAVDLAVFEAEAVKHLASLRFDLVAAQVLILLLHVPEAIEDGVHLVDPRWIGHGVLQLEQLVMEVADTPAAGDGLVEHGASGHLIDLLTEVADREFARDRHHAVVGRFFADDHAEERRLARTIRPHQSGLLAGVELE